MPKMFWSVCMLTVAASLSGTAVAEEKVREYRAPKDPPPAAAKPTAPAGQPSAPAGAAQGSASQGTHPHWKLPEGWREDPKPAPMRYATFLAGEGDTQLTVAVTRFPGNVGGMLANLNRWRGQIGLKPWSEQELAQEIQKKQAIRPLEGAQPNGLLIDITGPGADGATPQRTLVAMFEIPRSETWFFKATASEKAIAANIDSFLQFSKSATFDAGEAHAQAPGTGQGGPQPAGGAAAPAGDDKLESYTWDVPAGFTRAATIAPMVLDDFEFSDGTRKARITVSKLGGNGGGALPNINRWRGQLGLPPAEDVDPASLTPLTVAGSRAIAIDLASQAFDPALRQRMIVVMAPRQGEVWFLKLTGAHPLVEQQKQAFLNWAQSLRKKSP